MLVRMIAGSSVFLEVLPPDKPGGASRTRATMQAHIDAGAMRVPSFIITFCLKVRHCVVCVVEWEWLCLEAYPGGY
jgi:hypothetical protein